MEAAVETPVEAPKPVAPAAIKTTESMVTVRLSDSDSESPNLPSPTPTLKLVDEKSEEYLLDDKEPLYVPERTESPASTEAIPLPPIEEAELETKQENTVDWEGLEKTEGEQTKVEGSEEVPSSPSDAEDPTAKKPPQGTEFLLARLEQENKRIEQDPKAHRAHPERPPSLATLREMIANPDPNTLRYSMLPPKVLLTDLDFWAAVVADYNRAASRLPILLSTKIRGGVPPPLRGVVWIAASGARDCNLEGLYEQLLGENSPYEHQIGKDVGRTGLDMFRQEGGEGQRMLGRVLRAFSVYDSQIGYCQGLGFLVGPLLMHMLEKEAFCVLVRLMEFYDLRSCFMPDMAGLHLRMFQFTELLAAHLPQLSKHLNDLGIQPTYASQWFLSFFAISCPLPMLFRIYDVIFAEGAPETIMRVALSLMRRNEKRLLATAEFDEVMTMLLSRSLWDTYNCNADDLVQDFVGLSGIVTKATLTQLEAKFSKTSAEEAAKLAPATKTQASDLQAAAARFLGRLWGGGSQGAVSLSPITLPTARNSKSGMARTPSKQSLSTVSSYETTNTSDSGSSDATSISRCSTYGPPDDRRLSTRSISSMRKAANPDGELHGQIEDLLVALSTLQREHNQKIEELASIKQSRDEERDLTRRLVQLLSSDSPDETETVTEISELCDTLTEHFVAIDAVAAEEAADTARLTDELENTKERLKKEEADNKALAQQLAEQENEVASLKKQMATVKSKYRDLQLENQKLSRSLTGLKTSAPRRANSSDSPVTPDEPSGGLREFKLGRTNTSSSITSARSKRDSTITLCNPIFSKRASSLGMAGILAANAEKQKEVQRELTPPPPTTPSASEEQLVSELVAAKTAEAVAKQEAEEAKQKLEALKKMLAGKGGPISPGVNGNFHLQTPPQSSAGNVNSGSGNSGGGGGFWGWGAKKTVAGGEKVR